MENDLVEAHFVQTDVARVELLKSDDKSENVKKSRREQEFSRVGPFFVLEAPEDRKLRLRRLLRLTLQ